MTDVAIRRVFRVVNGGTPTSDESNWNGDVLWATPVDLAGVDGSSLTSTARTVTRIGMESGSSAVPAGSLVVSTRAPIGYVAETTRETAFNQGCRGLVPRVELDLRFFRYQLLARRADLVSRGQGSTFAELSSDSLAAFKVRWPSVSGQREIADFLDAETARIDALIDKKRRMIALLRERFVSARREMSVRLASSSGRLALRRCVRCLDGRRIPLNAEERAERQGDYPYWGAGTIVDYIDDYLFDEPLVLLGEDGAPFFDDSREVAFFVNERVWVNNHIHVLRPRDGWSPRFLMHMLNAVDFSRYITGSTRDKLTQAEMDDIRIPSATKAQQDELVAELDALERRATELRTRLEMQIRLLHEHRQALITAAVTSDLDVVTAAA